MSRIPEYTHNVSLRMSLVMDEIGVNEKIVMKRRKSFLLSESIDTLTQQLMDRNRTTYFFGSKIEGTTTPGLNSDTDNLFTMNRYNVIQNWSEWEHGKRNLLMIQDESVSPGYCFLQLLRNDVPLPTIIEMNEHSFRDEKGRILLKNTVVNVGGDDKHFRQGPAQLQQGDPGFCDVDCVCAFICQSYAVQAIQRPDQHREEYWPSYDMIQYCSNMGCFVVGVGSKGSVNEELEWRISTSLAERCLMFNLNITQIRCYVLMKMTLKKFISPGYPGSISSFMCKTVLFHCISNSSADEWKESTLLTCLTFCLSTLYNFVLNEYCPHFLIPENNLMARRFSQENKPHILEALYNVIESNGKTLLEIECDNFGLLLLYRLNGIKARGLQNVSILIAGHLSRDIALELSESFYTLLCQIKDTTIREAIRKVSTFMTYLNAQYHHIDRKACKLIAHYLCQTMGTILAYSNIEQRDDVSYQSLLFMSLGLNSDVASGKLKLASMFYCIGDTVRTELILRNIEDSYDFGVVELICKCYDFKYAPTRKRFNILCYGSDKEHTLIKSITASCVRFLRCEVNCCPHELRHEMFRSTQGDLANRGLYEKWMEMAVVDSLPFLYFLQYKTYTRIGKEKDRNRVLSNLVKTIENEANLGHRETALNLLGQCMENENEIQNAFKCYALSLKLRERNNAAKIHTCLLLDKVINHPEH